MILVRALLASVLLALIVGLPALMLPEPPDGSVTAVSAAPANQSRHPERDQRNRNQNWNENGNENGNGNDNSNDVDDGDDEPPRERPGASRPSSAVPQPPASTVGRCFAVGQSGALALILDGGTVTLSVVPTSTFGRDSRVTLAKVDPASVPATPGPRVDEIVFEIRAQEGCDGNALTELPADTNLGVSYRVPAEKPKLRLAILEGDRWLDVPTVPDPADPYVSATVRRTGIYVLYQAP